MDNGGKTRLGLEFFILRRSGSQRVWVPVWVLPSAPWPLCFPVFIPLFWNQTRSPFQRLPPSLTAPTQGRNQAPAQGPQRGCLDQGAGGGGATWCHACGGSPTFVFNSQNPSLGSPTGPRAPPLSLGHLVVVAMETTSKMACKSTQAITRGRWGRGMGRGVGRSLSSAAPIRVQWMEGMGRWAQAKGVPIQTPWEKRVLRRQGPCWPGGKGADQCREGLVPPPCLKLNRG